MTEAAPHLDVLFRSSALGAGDLVVHRMTGVEGISRTFEFDLILETTTGGALELSQLDDIQAGTAYLAFGNDELHKYHGVIRRIEMMSMADPTPVQYRMRFVPRMWDLELTFGSWVFQDLNVKEIVTDVLTTAGFHDGEDFEFHLTGTYPKREYVVQYDETDLNFVQRQLEHWGIFYFFEHGNDRDKVIFADSNKAFTPLEGHENIPYDPRASATQATEPITALGLVQTVIPQVVRVTDYNYRIPSVDLHADAKIDPKGVGLQIYYGEHVKDPRESKRMALVRAEEVGVRKLTFTGGGRVRGLRSGHAFTLEGHLLAGLDMKYLVTELRHRVVQAGATTTEGGSSGSEGYTNEFVAIPYAVPFRPQRVTHKPRIIGLIHGRVDAGGDDGVSAPIDEHGRYKVLLPFDAEGKAGGKASRWIRMASSSAGGGYGMHMPLHVGTEVAIEHVLGDPDRPIIVGAVPNHETTSPSTAANATQSVMKTRTGIQVTFDDSPK